MKFFIKVILFVCFNLLGHHSQGQVYSDKNPVNFYYKKLEYVDLPLEQKQKQGNIFYHIDEKYVQNYLEKQISINYEKIANEIELYNYRKDKYRYNNYRIEFNKVSYKNTDLLHVEAKFDFFVLADRSCLKWRWRKFKFELEKVSDFIVYNSTVSVILSFAPDTVFSEALIDKLSIPHFSFKNNIYGPDLQIDGYNSSSFLYLSLNESLITKSPTVDKIDRQFPYLKYNDFYRAFILYFSIKK